MLHKQLTAPLFAMKKLIGFILIFVSLGIVITVTISPTDDRHATDKFREAMLFVDYHTYYDNDFDYSFSYPSFMTKDETPDYGVGHVQYSYHNLTDLIMECKVVPESVFHHREKNVVVEGSVPHYDGFKYFAHYICRNRLWYMLTLYYHDEYREAVRPLIHRVATWKVKAESSGTTGRNRKQHVGVIRKTN